MATTLSPLTYTEIEVRSYLPSGWGIVAGQAGRWDAAQGRWSIEIYDGADNTWTIAIGGEEAARTGRLDALREGIDRLTRKSLGRKSIISG